MVSEETHHPDSICDTDSWNGTYHYSGFRIRSMRISADQMPAFVTLISIYQRSDFARSGRSSNIAGPLYFCFQPPVHKNAFTVVVVMKTTLAPVSTIMLEMYAVIVSYCLNFIPRQIHFWIVSEYIEGIFSSYIAPSCILWMRE